MPFDEAGVYTLPEGTDGIFGERPLTMSKWHSAMKDIEEALNASQGGGGQPIDLSIYGFKGLFQNRYTGPSVVSLADNGKAHVKADATLVTLPNTLPDELLTTIINDNGASWLRVNFTDALAVVQGSSNTAGAAAWELSPNNMLSITKLRSGLWLVSGRVRIPV